jgi:type I restriction enzyme, S subunit
MITKTIRSSWWEGYGYRLDCQPYLAGALDTRIILERLPARKEALIALTIGPGDGIYHAGREPRRWVESEQFGIPFISSSDLLSAEFSALPLMSREQIENNPLLLIHAGWTLITRSGTIGKVAYARAEMDGLACSEHVMRVVPDTAKVESGYLYAYLSSKFGVPLVVSGTYGSIIQSIEPEHIANLPVPRLEAELEHRIHVLVEEAAVLRCDANDLVERSLEEFERVAGLPPSAVLRNSPFPNEIVVKASELSTRLDTSFHGSYHYAALQPYLSGKVAAKTLGQLAESIIEPQRFKRVQMGPGEFTIPFFGTGSLGDADPEPLYYIPRKANIDSYRVNDRTLLIPRSGQLNGIIGCAYTPIGKVLTGAVTEDAIRVSFKSREDAGYVFLALRSEYGLRQLKARCFGGSIPHLDVGNVSGVLVPDLKPKVRLTLGADVSEAAKMRTLAIEKENEARALLTNAIESRSRV